MNMYYFDGSMHIVLNITLKFSESFLLRSPNAVCLHNCKVSFTKVARHAMEN